MQSRGIVVSVLVTVALAGCLFPSLDDLQSTSTVTPKSKTKTSPSSTSTGDTTSPDSPPPVPPTGVPPTPPQTNPDSGTLPNGPPKVQCGGNTCSPPGNRCCANMVLDPDCTTGSNDDCAFTNFGNARMFACDGPEDCQSGQVCCFVDTSAHGAVCEATCAGQTLCHTPADCAAGKACGAGVLFDGTSFHTCAP